MTAYDSTDAEILELAVRALGGSAFQQSIVQKAYDLGRSAGRIEQVAATRAMLAAPAACSA